MFPEEINLPIDVEFFQPQIIADEGLNFNELQIKLLNSGIETLMSHQDILIIINDQQRSTPSHKILSVIDNLELNSNIKAIAIASGSHVQPNESDVINLTRNYHKKWDIPLIFHDGLSKYLVEIGTTSRGTIVRVNSILQNHKTILCINSVEPHFFAGFTGGIKSIIPGLAAKSTIEKNHSWALDPRTGPTKIDDNPLLDDLWEAGSFLESIFLGIQLVSVHEQIFDITIGNLRDAFKDATTLAESIFSVKTGKLYDVVVSVVYPPLSDSLYQSQKGIENTRDIVKEGGELILISSMKDKIGNNAFYETMKKYSSPDEILENLSQASYVYGDHKAVKFATLVKSCKLSIVGNLSTNECKNVFAYSLSENRLEDYLRELSKDKKTIAIVLDSGNVVVTP